MVSAWFITPWLMESSYVLAVAVSGFLLFFIIALSILQFDWQHGQLLRIVQESLGDRDVL
jgi:hypothetical protein